MILLDTPCTFREAPYMHQLTISLLTTSITATTDGLQTPGDVCTEKKKKILNDELNCAAAEEGITSFFLWPHPGITQ